MREFIGALSFWALFCGGVYAAHNFDLYRYLGGF
jgi:hypothetical protein